MEVEGIAAHSFDFLQFLDFTQLLESLDAFLLRVAKSIGIPEKDRDSKVGDWKQILEECSTVPLLQELAEGKNWEAVRLSPMVKTKITNMLPKPLSGILFYSILFFPLS